MNPLALAIRVVVLAAALWVAIQLVDGIELTGSSTQKEVGTLLLVAVIFAVVNAVLKPLIKVVGCVFYLLTLGLIGLVVNALLFLLVSAISESVGLPFEVDGFWDAFWGAIIIGVVSFLLHVVIPDRLDRR